MRLHFKIQLFFVFFFSSADFADFKEFFNDVVKDVTIKQNLNAISGSISKDTNEAFSIVALIHF